MKRLLLNLALSALSGAMVFLSVANFDIWPLAWFALVPLLWVVETDRPRRAFLHGWVMGAVTNAGGFYWITSLLVRFGHLPMVAAVPLMLLLAAYQGLLFGGFTLVVRRLRDHLGWPMALLAPVTMVAFELVVPFIFPWYMAISQAWVVPVIQIADLTGPLGVTFLLALANGALYDLLHARLSHKPWPRRTVLAAAATLLLALGYGALRLHQVDRRWQAAPKARVGVVQANIGINVKGFAGTEERQLLAHQQLSADLARRGADLIVWPESSYPYVIRRDQERDFPQNDPRAVRRGFTTPLVFGAITFGSSPYPYNSALMMDGDGRLVGSFDKNFLLIFGEYIPYYEKLRFLRRWVPAMSNFARGTEVTTFPFDSPTLGSHKLGPMICYEDILPEFGRRVAKLKPNLFVNITNDAWFGATSEPWEHLALSVFRAVEHRIGLVRAVNTGVSAFIDASGRLGRHGPAVDPLIDPDVKPVTLLEDMALLEGGSIYATLGDLFGYINLAAVLGMLGWTIRMRLRLRRREAEARRQRKRGTRR